MNYRENDSEMMSGLSRVRQAENLIAQLPTNHDGRNTWLLRYGTGPEAVTARRERNLAWDDITRSAIMTRDSLAPEMPRAMKHLGKEAG